MKKLAIIDDSPMMLSFLERFLQENWRVESFEGPLEFIKAFEEEKYVPHIIIADLQTEGLSAVDLMRFIKRTNLNIPVLIISSNGNIDIKVECLETGATDFIQKPFNPRELEARIKKVAFQQDQDYHVH